MFLLFLINPLLGWAGVVGAIMQTFVAWMIQQASRKPLLEAQRRAQEAQAYADASLRNTQVMENAAGILERYRSLLEEVSGTIERLRAGHAATGETIDQALERILSNIRLSDIRVRYVEALRKANIHSPGGSDGTPAAAAGSIELF